MDLLRAAELRHAVRQFTDQPLDAGLVAQLEEKIAWANKEAGLNIKLVTEEPTAFASPMAKMLGFKQAKNYLIMAAPAGEKYDELLGYYGQQIVLFAQTQGLNSCWAAGTYKRRKVRPMVDGKVRASIALGYGATQGNPHEGKSPVQVTDAYTDKTPDWFKEGVRLALLAPTSMDRQGFYFTLNEDGSVTAKGAKGSWSALDLGIVKFQFELGAGTENFSWK